MPVSDDVDLRIIDDKTLDKLTKDADHLDKLATKAEKDAERLKRATRLKGGGPASDISKAEKSPIGGGHTEPSIFTGTGGEPPIITRDGSVYKKVKSGSAPSDIASHGISTPISGAFTGKLKGGGAPADLKRENRLVQDEKKIMTLEQKVNKTEKFLQSGLSFIRNPNGFLSGSAFSLLGRLGLAGAVAQFGIGFIQDILEMVKGQFGPGGLFDTRKLVLNEVKTVTSLKTLVNISNGNLFFTDDAGLSLRQSGPAFSNTRQLRNGHLRYIQLYQGT